MSRRNLFSDMLEKSVAELNFHILFRVLAPEKEWNSIHSSSDNSWNSENAEEIFPIAGI